jgi:hydroxyquinol 1,2-dioxygenase
MHGKAFARKTELDEALVIPGAENIVTPHRFLKNLAVTRSIETTSGPSIPALPQGESITTSHVSLHSGALVGFAEAAEAGRGMKQIIAAQENTMTDRTTQKLNIDARERGYFTEEDSVEVVTGRTSPETDPRLKQVVEVLVRKLHEAVKELEPTQEEWMEGITFLTRTGHTCTDWRQEFILLSDIMGISMLVDAINSRRPSGATENTVLGPFHLADAPEMDMGTNICLDGKGEPMLVHGRVLDTDGSPLSGVKIDVWQANDEGFYDVQQKGIQPDFNLRGVFRTGNDGRYWFTAVKPKFYPIPDDGPVGQLLKALGRHPFRPAHFHYIVEKDGFDKLTTHIFDPDDHYINSDAVFGVKESLMAEFKPVDDPKKCAEHGFSGRYYDVENDFVLARL